MALGIIKNYEDLKDNIADYLDRLDLVAQIPGFIQLCEASINRVLRTHAMVCKGQTVGSRSDNFIPLPDDWLEGRNVEVVTLKDNPDDPGNLIDDRTYQATYQSTDVIDQMKQKNVQFNPGTAVNFTYYGSTLEIYPNPGQDFRIVMEYYARIGPLSDNAPDDVNHLLLSDPDIYLYGSLINSAPFLRDDPRLMVWTKLYESAINSADAASKTAMTSGSRLTRKVNVNLG